MSVHVEREQRCRDRVYRCDEGVVFCFFFFQAEDGIRDVAVTGVQTCALPIYRDPARSARALSQRGSRSPVVARVRDVRPEHLRRDRRRAGGDSRVRGEARADFLGPLSDYPRRPPAIIRKNAGDRRGSSVSRMPSPRRLNASTVTVMARPGKKASHHGGTSAGIEAASKLPPGGGGGGTPTPRKPSAASMTIAAPRCVVARTR